MASRVLVRCLLVSLILASVVAPVMANYHYAEHLAFSDGSGSSVPGLHQLTDSGEHEAAHQYCDECRLFSNLLALQSPSLLLLGHSFLLCFAWDLINLPRLSLFKLYDSRAPPILS